MLNFTIHLCFPTLGKMNFDKSSKPYELFLLSCLPDLSLVISPHYHLPFHFQLHYHWFDIQCYMYNSYHRYIQKHTRKAEVPSNRFCFPTPHGSNSVLPDFALRTERCALPVTVGYISYGTASLRNLM